MKKTFITILISVFSSLIASFCYDLKIVKTMTWERKLITFCVAFVLTYLLIHIVLTIWDSIKNGGFKARWNLFIKGKIEGLWTEKGLIKQIEKHFSESDEIRVKVTRGVDLFDKDDKYGFVPYLNKIQKEERQVHIKFLLIVPCFKEEHVKIRYERHKKYTVKEFLETWYKCLQKMKPYQSDKLSIAVRFYAGGHARWRYYIFHKANKKKASVFLAHYDRHSSGSEQPMYKIIKSDRNIASFMTDYFDDLWKEAITPSDLKSRIINGNCMKCGCEYVKENENCQFATCEYQSVCKGFVEQYKEYLG